MMPDKNTKDITYDAPEDLRNSLKCAIMELTDKQVEYVLWRLECLKQENSF